MKPYQRRATTNAYLYYKVATWDGRSYTWRDGKKAFPTYDDAITAASAAAGMYRISRVTEGERSDAQPFLVHHDGTREDVVGFK